MRRAWWQWGLIGGATLSLATLSKVLIALPRLLSQNASWHELPGVAALVFVLGFVCGVVAWLGSGLSRRWGRVGDALLGAIVMNVFFLGCMVVFAREVLAGERSGAGLFFLMATALGTLGGTLVGRDLRAAPDEGRS
jgi:hypothetical protein